MIYFLQSDYLRKISLKMLTMETKSQNPMANPLQANAANASKNPPDQGIWMAYSLSWIVVLIPSTF